MRYEESTGEFLGRCPIDFALLSTKTVAFTGAALSGFDAAPATPAQAMAGAETMHLLAGVMDPAAVTKNRFCHGGL